MDFEWVALALGDVAWLSLAFALGMLAKFVGLPPLVGFLAAGFMLNALGMQNGQFLEKLADLGITLLLFTVGLKIDLRTLFKPQVWAVTGMHTLSITLLFGLALYALALAGAPFLAGIALSNAILIGFALSFSSTVFVVKALEEKSQMYAAHGRAAIGILIMQDILAVLFLAVSANMMPSPWVFALVLLWPLRRMLFSLLDNVGHGELLVLYGFILAMGGAKLFEMVEMKGDLGALVFGVMIASHAAADDMAKTLLGFKDLFLLGFFLSIGLAASLNMDVVLTGIALAPLVIIKSALFFALFSAFKLRARTSLLATLNLSNYSEFGLIVAAVGVSHGWLEAKWLAILAIAMSVSFLIAAVLDRRAHKLYVRYREYWQSWQRRTRLPEDADLQLGDCRVAVIGMGVVGTGAYDKACSIFGDVVIGIDIDPKTIASHRQAGRRMLEGDPGDTDFWERVQRNHELEHVFLTLPKLSSAVAVLRRLREVGFQGQIASIAKFPDEIDILKREGAASVFNVFTEAGAGFASDAAAQAGVTP